MYFSDVFGPIKWHMLACAVAFYALPALQFVIAPESVMLLLLICGAINIAVIAVTGIALTIKEGFKWYYPLVVIVLYAPTLLMYYDVSMMVNILTYLILAYISQIIGYIVAKIIAHNR